MESLGSDSSVLPLLRDVCPCPQIMTKKTFT